MLKVNEIREFIEEDKMSDKKRLARIGQRYYDAEHDILQYKVFFVDADGKFQEDKTKANIKVSHPFFTELTDQLVQYSLSGENGIFRSDIPELQTELDTYFNDNEDFEAELYELVTGTIVKGFENMYAYKNSEGRTAFQCADSMGVVEVKAREASDNQDHIIYWYVDKVDKDGHKIKKIQDWDSKQAVFYVQVDDGKIALDESCAINPRPHVIYTKDNDTSTYFEDYGFIPFFRLDNCKKQFSGLKPIKPLIDDYDLMSCGLSNNIQDTNEALYVVKGFQGDNLDELMVNVKAKKHIGVDEEGGVDIVTVDIPYEARQAKLELDEKNIYRFGMGLNTAGLKDTAATTNIAIKSAYTLLDLRANKMEVRLKQFLRKLLKVVLKEINDTQGTDYQQKDVYFVFEREVPTNAQENAQIELTEAQRKQTEITTLLNISTQLDNETLMQLICEQLDLDYDDIKDKLPDPEEAKSALNNTQAVLDETPEEETVEAFGGDVA